MTARTVAQSTTRVTLPRNLRLGAVELTVTDLDRSIPFYEQAIGLRAHWCDGNRAGIGVGGEDVLVLVEEPTARPAGRHAGLYHVALLLPSREELARAAVRLGLTKTGIYGASDHETHEAIYLPDPDANELELAADRPREEWPDLATYGERGPAPLDFSSLLATIAGEEPNARAAPGLRIGHVHLYVGDIASALGFYRDTLGFELKTALPTAAFMSVNGYHHHVAVNTWRGVGVPPTPPNTVGLRHWTVLLDTREQVAEVASRVRAGGYVLDNDDGSVLARDPWGIAVLFTAGANA